MKKTERIILLYNKYVHESLTAEELLEWIEVVQDPTNAEFLDSLMLDTLVSLEPEERAKDWQPAFERFSETVGLARNSKASGKTVKVRLFRYWPYAAAVVALFTLFSTYFIWKQSPDSQSVVSSVPKEDVAPGGYAAILRSSDGEILNLSEQGELVVRDGSLEDGTGRQLNGDNSETVWRTIEVPKKGHYRLVLSDGTQVWLNAASSLRFPLHFDENNRTVHLTGEAFFEVTENKKRPFIVQSQNHSVTVLGTSFNVSAYPNEHTQTTLLTGSVKVNAANGQLNLQPGMQSDAFGDQLTRRTVDVESVAAWKDNRFVFVKEPLTDIMKKLERWYDVEFVIQKGSEGLLTKTFSGSLTRYSQLSETLELFSYTESLNYSIKGRTVYLKK
ncbi:MAG: DUF4974 domain-containing protein [Sphingobacterium sp.]|jgi:hypothetical protein|nr:DUF4974 domain-containing protein [Sphingobacterium sp.]